MGDAPKKRKHTPKQLLVVFDTNALHVGSATEVMKLEIVNLIRESTFPDLHITWYMPTVVRHERQYQMEKEAETRLFPTISKLEELLGHQLAITKEYLLERVASTIDSRLNTLGVAELKLDNTRVDWSQLARDATYRRPPFQIGDKEKGFRDALLVESFVQLVEESPKSAQSARVVLISNDKLMKTAVEGRLTKSVNVHVLSTVEDLKGLINTLTSDVDETFIDLLKPKAEKMFFRQDRKEDSFIRKGEVLERIQAEFAPQLTAVPSGAASRRNVRWTVYPPNFVRKIHQRVFWSTRIVVEAEAVKLTNFTYTFSTQSPTPEKTRYIPLKDSEALALWAKYISSISTIEAIEPSYPEGYAALTHKGTDTYEISWSCQVTTSKELRQPRVEEITHKGTDWEAVGS